MNLSSRALQHYCIILIAFSMWYVLNNQSIDQLINRSIGASMCTCKPLFAFIFGTDSHFVAAPPRHMAQLNLLKQQVAVPNLILILRCRSL